MSRPRNILKCNLSLRKVTKIAVLPEKNFLNLKEAYPKWYARLMKEEKVYKVVLSIKQRIEEIVERRKSDKLNNSPTKNKKKKMLRINTSPNIAKKLKSAFSGNPIGYAMAKVVEGSSDDTSSKPNSARGSKPESQVATPQNRRGSLRQTPQSSKRLTPVNDVPQNNGLPKHPIDFDALNTSLRKFEVSENGDLVPSLPNTPKKKKESPTKKLPPIENPGVPGVPRKSAFAQPVTPNESPTKISPGKAKNKQFEVLTTPKKKNEYNMDSAIRESREFSEYDNSMMDAPSPMLIKKAKDLKKKDVIFVRSNYIFPL